MNNIGVRRTLLILVLATASLFAATAGSALAATLTVGFGSTGEGASTGTAPFDAVAGPGNDTGADDHVIRTNDLITYRWSVAVNDGDSPNTTFTQTLPEGMAWLPLPAFCLTDGVNPPSGISGRTITCNIGDRQAGTGSADNFYVTARVAGDLANGTELTTRVTVSSSDSGTAPADSAEVTDVVSAAPRVNVTKDPPALSATLGYRGDVWGWFMRFPLSLNLKPTLVGKGMKGNELLQQPLSITDEFVNGGYGLELIECGVNTAGTFPNMPRGTGGGPNGVTDSGTIACTQPDGPGGSIEMSIQGADLSGAHTPDHSANGGPIPTDTEYLATYYISGFIPMDELPLGTPIQFENRYTQLDDPSISGQPNQDDPSDNASGVRIERTEPNPATISLSKWFGPPGESDGSWPDGHAVYPDTVVWTTVRVGNSGNVPMPANQVAACDLIDTTTFRLTEDGGVVGPNGQPAFISQDAFGVVEFGTGGTRGHDQAGWDATRPDDCSDGSSPTGWTTDASSVPGGLDAITKVRVRITREMPPSPFAVYLRLNLEVRDQAPGEAEPLRTGTILANFARSASDWGSGNPTWGEARYEPATGQFAQTGDGAGARLRLTTGSVRIEKDTDPSGKQTAVAGETVGYRLTPTVSGDDLPGGVMQDVVVTDRLDPYQSYVEGSAQPEPTSITSAGGATTLTWELGDVPVNQPVPEITYQARIALNTPTNQDVVNTATIESPQDASALNLRQDAYTIAVNTIAGIRIAKTAETPVVEPGGEAVFAVEYANSSTSDLAQMEVIDVLPWNGDARGSSFSGTVSLAGVETSGGELVLYTSRDPGEVIDNPKDPSNQMPGGSTVWCSESQFASPGCPADLGDVTAIRVINDGGVEVGESNTFRVALDTSGGAIGDVYGNRAVVASPTVTFPAFSSAATARVEADAAVGDFVWVDRDRDGVQDAGEPGRPGVTVRLTGTDRNGDPVDRTTTTDADGSYLFEGLVSGEYRVAFTLPAGYEFTAPGAGSDPNRDSNANQDTGQSGLFVLSPDQHDLSRDAGLLETGSITIVKDAVNDADVDFAFTTTGGLSPDQFTLNDDGAGNENQRTFTGLAPGEYSIAEQPQPGWALTGLECEGASGFNVVGATATVDLQGGEDVTCTYTNTQLAQVTIHKQANPEADVDFEFTASGGLNPGRFTLNDDGSGDEDRQVFAEVLPGGYEFSETPLDGWELTGLSCTGTQNWSRQGPGVDVQVAPGDVIDCTFVNEREEDTPPPGNPPADPASDLRLVKEVDSPKLEVGQVGTYRLTVTNDGPDPDTDVVVSDPLPAQLTFVSASEGCSFADRTVTCRLDSLAVGASHTFTLQVKVKKGTEGDEVLNVARVTGRNPDPCDGGPENPACDNNEGRVTIKVPKGKKPRIVLRKKADRKAAEPGQAVRYRIQFRNAAKGTVARDVKVCDRVPAHMTLVKLGGGKLSDGRVCWTVAKLPYSKSWRSRSLVMRVDSDARPGSRLTNVVTSGKAKAKATVRVERPEGFGEADADQAGGVTG